MARYELKAPDGSLHEVVAPDGATEAEVMAYFQANWKAALAAPAPMPPPPKPRQRWDLAGDTARAFSQGVEGMKESASAAFPAPDDRAAQIAADRKDYGPIIGNTVMPVVREGQRFGNALMAPLHAMGAAMSPLTGGIHAGVGSVLSYLPGVAAPGEDPKAAADNMLDTSMLAMRPGGRYAVNKVIPAGRETMTPAERMVLDRLDAGETSGAMTPEKIAAAAADVPDKPVAISDFNKGARDLSGSLHRKDTGSGAILEDFLNGRDVDEWRRVGVDVDTAFGRDSTLTTEKKIIAERSAAADPLRRMAFAENKSVQSKDVDRLLETPALQKAFRMAVEDMQNNQSRVGVTDPELTALAAEQGIVTGYGVAGGLKLEVLDFTKRALDRMIRVAKQDPSTGDYATLTGLRKDFVKALDAADITAQAGPNSLRMFRDPITGKMVEGGVYKEYRRTFSGPSQSLDAMEWGQQALGPRMSPEQIRETMAKMGPGDRSFALLGVRDTLMREIMSTIAGADQAKIAGGGASAKPWRTEQLRALIDDPVALQAFMKGIETEAMMHASKVDMIGNSATARRAAEDAKSSAAGYIENMMQAGKAAKEGAKGNVLGMAAHALDFAKQRFSRTPDPQVAQEATRIMNSPINPPRVGPVAPGPAGMTEGQNFLANLPRFRQQGQFGVGPPATPGALPPGTLPPPLGLRLARPPVPQQLPPLQQAVGALSPPQAPPGLSPPPMP